MTACEVVERFKEVRVVDDVLEDSSKWSLGWSIENGVFKKTMLKIELEDGVMEGGHDGDEVLGLMFEGGKRLNGNGTPERGSSENVIGVFHMRIDPGGD